MLLVCHAPIFICTAFTPFVSPWRTASWHLGRVVSHRCREALPRGAIDPSRQKYVWFFSAAEFRGGVFTPYLLLLWVNLAVLTHYAVITCSAHKRPPSLSYTIGLYALRVFLAGRFIAFGGCYKHIRPGAMKRPLGKPLTRPRGSMRTSSPSGVCRGGVVSNYFPLG